MDLELPYGPWKRLSYGEWSGYPTTIYINPDRLLLLSVFEKHGEEVTGVLTVVKKALLTDADLSKAASAQRKEYTAIEKHSQEGSKRFVLIGSTPAYSEYSQAAMVETVGRQVAEVKAMAKAASEIAEAYRAKSTDLSGATEEEAQALLGDPFLLFSLLNPSSVPVQQSDAREQRVPLGLTASGEAVAVPLSALSAVAVVGGSRDSRLHAVHVLAEAALTNDVPALLFDSTEAFAGFAKANADTKDFTRNRMTPMPLGFPYKDYRLGNGFFIDLELVDSGLFVQSLGLDGTQAGKVILAAWDERPKHGIAELSESVAGFHGDATGFTAYDVSKAVRALAVVDKTMPRVFAKMGENDLLVPWHDGIGKVFHVNASGFGETAQHLAVSSLLRSMPLQKARKLRAVVAFEADLTGVYGDVLELIANARDAGIGFILHAEHELDLQLLQSPSLRLELVGGEVVASREGEKPVRFVLRPTYTACAEMASVK